MQATLLVTILTVGNTSAVGSALEAPVRVLVPSAQNPHRCLLLEQLAARLALSDQLEVVRAPLSAGQTLETARQNTSAAVALNAAKQAPGKDVRVFITQPQKSSESAAASIHDALEKVWQAQAPALPSLPLRTMGAANRAALFAACQGNAKAAYAHSGAAVGALLRERLPPPQLPKNAPPLLKLSAALHRARKGDCRAAIGPLRSTLTQLQRGALVPIWRRAPPNESAPGSLDLMYGQLFVFDNGSFIALDPQTGERRWSRAVGAAEPHLIDLGDGVVAAILQRAIEALDATSGALRWRLDIPEPHPELVGLDGHVFVASSQELLAVDRQSGDILWTHDPLAPIIAGPRFVGSQLALGAGTKLLLIDPQDGDVQRTIELGDELSSSVAVTPLGRPWLMIGSDQAVLIDPKSGEIERAIAGLPGATWPPAFVGEQPVLPAKRGQRPFVAYLDPKARSGMAKMLFGAQGPVLSTNDFSSVLHLENRARVISARDLSGRSRWSRRLGAPVRGLRINGARVLAASRGTGLIMEAQTGKTIASVQLDGEISELLLSSEGGAALLDNGVIYGLPSGRDPRPQRLLYEARVWAAQCHLQLNQTTAARNLAQTLISRRADDPKAWLIRAQAAPGATAIADWQKVDRLTEGREPKVQEALQKLAGLTIAQRGLSDAVVAPDANVVLTLSNGRATAMKVDALQSALWSKPAKKIEADSAKSFIVDGQRVAPADGKALGGVPQRHRRLSGLRFKGESGNISRLDQTSQTLWTARGRLLGADRAQVLTVNTASASLSLRSVSTGAALWSIAIPSAAKEPPAAGWLSERSVMIALGERLLGFDRKTGAPTFSKAGSAQTEIAQYAGGYIQLEGNRITAIEGARGRTSTARLPSPIAHFCVSAPQPESPLGFAALRSGQLVAIDLTRARAVGRANLGPIRKLGCTNTAVLALTEQGELLRIDPSRKLQPAR